jgi:hypothetical protein
MKLKETTKEIILTYLNESDIKGMEMPEINEKVLDFLIDEGHVDLSDDEFSDGYESLSNSVWAFIQDNILNN